MSKEIKFNDFFKKLYYNPSFGYKSASSLYKIAKEQEPKITLKIVKEFLNKQSTEQINKEVKEESQKTEIPIVGAIGHFQVDITDYPKYYKANNGYRYILNCIEINTKKAYSVPLKTKTKHSVLEAFQKIVKQP